ncbi:MAG: hypothetical protein LBV56_07300 [Delftia acidovorans]|nr:hypothetical protein [Delftia acidovorans]
MKERPILFSGSMVRALLAGTKTQTRRVAKPVRHPDLGNVYAPGALVLEHEPQHVIDRCCPYGRPGDRLWVREAFMHEPADFCWEAGVSIPCRPAETVYRADFPNSQPGEGWKPSIHMPRNLSRILLEITSVHVERLQDISEADALAEGVPHSLNLPGGRFARENFEHLWWTINGDGSWESNPWVWVVEFKRVQQASSGRPSQLEEAPCSA